MDYSYSKQLEQLNSFAARIADVVPTKNAGNAAVTTDRAHDKLDNRRCRHCKPVAKTWQHGLQRKERYCTINSYEQPLAQLKPREEN